MKHFLYIFLITLYAYALFVELPHDQITPQEFDAGHYAAWYGFPVARIEALAIVTAPGTTIVCFDRIAQDRSIALWNSEFSNRCVRVDSLDQIEDVDFVYLRADDTRSLGADWSLVYADGWGMLYRRAEE